MSSGVGMRKWSVSVAVACLLGAIGGTVVANAGSNITSPETFTVVGATKHNGHFVDLDKPGHVSAGDVVLLVLELTDENGTNVGKARVQCTVHVNRWQICIETWDITDRGEIVGEGRRPPYEGTDSLPFDLAITGGTGEFSNVRGTVHAETLDGGERATFDLTP